MIDWLQTITIISSIIAFILIVIVIGYSIIALKKIAGGGGLKRSLSLHIFFLILFCAAVGFMALYHDLSSDFFEHLWYLALFISLSFGIWANMNSYQFWKGIKDIDSKIHIPYRRKKNKK